MSLIALFTHDFFFLISGKSRNKLNYFNFQVFSPFGTPQTHSLVTDGLYRRGNIGKLLGNKTKQNHEAYQETLP